MKSLHVLTLMFLFFWTNGFAQFEEPIALETSISSLYSVNSKDVDGDGDIDLLLARSFGYYYYENDGTGSFEAPVEIGTELRRISDLEIADLDMDGDLDIAYVSGKYTKSIGWLENDGAGGYETRVFDIESDDLGKPFDLELADLDNDGDLDFITTNYDEEELRLTYNLGNGEFGDTQLLDSPVWMLNTQVYDNDNDGFPEIYFVSFTGSQIQAIGFYKRDPVGQYSINYIDALGGNNSNIFKQIDIDLDGDLDGIAGHHNGDNLEWAENLGNGEYGPQNTIWRGNDVPLDSDITYMHLERLAFGVKINLWTEDGNMYRIDQISGTNEFTDPVLLFAGPHEFPEEEIKITTYADYNLDGGVDIAYIHSDTLWMRMAMPSAVDNDNDGFTNDVDCDDTNADVNPDQDEIPYNGIDDDCDAATLDDDIDQDGFAYANDCDDTNADVNPGQAEIPYNGIDDDCDAATLDDDLDQDGFAYANDCDDTNADINPDAEEIANNGIDEDCDGMDLTSSTHDLGNSIINVYPNPTVDKINIDIIGSINYQVNLYSLNGKLLMSESNVNQLKLDSTPNGTYMLEIVEKETGQKIVEKIIVGK